jgi:putative ABC transport system permease protein
VDHFVLFFALVLSAIASIAFELAPAFLVANSNLQVNLSEGGARSGESSGGRRGRSISASGEIALAVMLLVAAGLLLRSFAKLTAVAVNPGFNVQHIVKAEIPLPRAQYSTPQQWIAFSDKLLRQMQSEPGLESAAVTLPAPIADRNAPVPFDIVGEPPLSANTSRTADYVSVSSDYFRTMGIPLLAGWRHPQNLGGNVFSAFAFPPDPGVPRQIVGIARRRASLRRTPQRQQQIKRKGTLLMR